MTQKLLNFKRAEMAQNQNSYIKKRYVPRHIFLSGNSLITSVFAVSFSSFVQAPNSARFAFTLPPLKPDQSCRRLCISVTIYFTFRNQRILRSSELLKFLLFWADDALAAPITVFPDFLFTSHNEPHGHTGITDDERRTGGKNQTNS